jgi:outer membrane protein TolC
MTKMFRFHSTTAALLIAALCAAPALAQDASDKARIDAIARNAAQEFAAAKVVDQTRPTTPITQAEGNVELTLDEATARALERNLDLAVERLNPETFDLSLARLHAFYRPTATSAIGQRAVTNPPTSQLNGGSVVTNDTTTYNAGLSQALPWGGGSLAVQFNNNKQVTSNIFANFNPTFNSNVAATLTQPLLRGFRIDGQRQQLRVTAISRDISDIQLRGTLATTLANVRNAYWELVYSIQALDVAKGALDLSEKLVQDNQARVEVGTMAPLDVIQAQAQTATNRQTLAQAEANRQTAELALKRMIVGGTDDPLWHAAITPIDRPTFRNETIDVETAVRKALSDRSDLQAAKKTLESNDITLRYLHNQTLPAVDLNANYGAAGLGGTAFIRQGSGLGSTITGTIPGGYADALSTLRRLDYPTWNVQVNVSYPIGASSGDASYARGRVQRNQSAAQLRSLELQIATEVTNAALQVTSGLTKYEAATSARELAETRLQAEQSRFEVGLSTNFFVVQAQRDLATAQNSELRALLDYRKALVDFERVQSAPANRGAGVTTISGN